MPKYTIQVPDGRTVVAEAPDEASAMQGIQEWYKSNPKQASTKETVVDAAKGVGSGLLKGGLDIGTAGAEIASAGANVARNLGVSEDTIDTIKDVMGYTPILGQGLAASQALRKLRKEKDGVMGAVNAAADYKPETTAGGYGKKIGEFALNAVGPKAGMLTRAAKYVAAPAIGAETGRKIFEGNDIEPVAEAIGGLAGMGGAAKLLNPRAQAKAVSKLPAAESFKQAADDAYNVLDNAGVYIKSSSMSKIFKGLEDHLEGINFIPGVDEHAANVLDHIQTNIIKGKHGAKPLSFREAEGITKVLGQKAAKATGDDRRILYAAKHYMDDALQNLVDVEDVVTGSADNLPVVKEALKTARANWTQKSKTDMLDEMVRLGEQSGHTAYSRGGVQLGTQREFAKYLRKPEGKRQRLRPDEIKAFDKVAENTYTGRALRNFGKLGSNAERLTASGGFGTGTGTIVGMFLGGPAGAAAGAGVGLGLPVLARLARNASNRMTAKQIADVQALIRSGKKLKRPYQSTLGKYLTLLQSLNQ
jgi:hypothetical protein